MYHPLCLCLPNNRQSVNVVSGQLAKKPTMGQHTEQADRHKGHYDRSDSYAYAQAARTSFHRPHTSLGAPGHLLHVAMVAAPLIITNLIEDPQKKWKTLAMVPVIGGVASELLWTLRIAQQKHNEKEARAALEDCEGRCR
jgi:hypothetical protein